MTLSPLVRGVSRYNQMKKSRIERDWSMSSCSVEKP